jgi:hypothetical protein
VNNRAILIEIIDNLDTLLYLSADVRAIENLAQMVMPKPYTIWEYVDIKLYINKMLFTELVKTRLAFLLTTDNRSSSKWRGSTIVTSVSWQ